MAKGRKLSTSRSERLLGVYDHGPSAVDSPEFGEDEVCSVINGVNEPLRHNSHQHAGIKSGLTLAFDEHHKTKTVSHNRIVHRLVSPRGQRHVAASAPVNVPDWTKIYRLDSVELLDEIDVYDDDDDYEDEVFPPHEYLAREYRRIAANSVFEGFGRTLKGRDMRRVRDSVWGQTGFNG